MGHEEEIKNYPTYWNRVRDTLGPLILDILNNKQLINEDKNDKLTIENVVRMKKIMSKITIVWLKLCKDKFFLPEHFFWNRFVCLMWSIQTVLEFQQKIQVEQLVLEQWGVSILFYPFFHIVALQIVDI